MTLTRVELYRPSGVALKRRNRPDILPVFTGEPTAATTGLNVLGLSLSDLTVVDGDLTINDSYIAAHPGAVVDRLWVKGHVLMTGTTPFTITNSYINGRTFPTYGSPPWNGLVRARRGDAPVTAVINLTNCLINPVQPDYGINCVLGERIGTITRCDISGGQDLVDYWNPAVPRVYGSYFHDMTFWDDDPVRASDGTHPYWSHNDCIQNSGSDGGEIAGNSFDIRCADDGRSGTATLKAWAPNRNYGTGCTMTPGNHITNMSIHDNWFRYGECHAFLSQQSGANDTGNSWKVFNNYHDLGMHGYGPYSGQYSKQIIRWHYLEGPQPSDVYGNRFLSDANVPVDLRGQLLPAAAVVGGTSSAGQYIISVNSATQ